MDFVHIGTIKGKAAVMFGLFDVQSLAKPFEWKRIPVLSSAWHTAEQMSAALFWADMNATFWKIHRPWIPPLWMELLFLSRCAHAVRSHMQHIRATKLIVNGCVCNWIAALFSHCDRSSIMTNNCQRGTMSLMTEGGWKGGEKCDNDESQCVPESQEAAASFLPLVQKQCQS